MRARGRWPDRMGGTEQTKMLLSAPCFDTSPAVIPDGQRPIRDPCLKPLLQPRGCLTFKGVDPGSRESRDGRDDEPVLTRPPMPATLRPHQKREKTHERSPRHRNHRILQRQL
jgi:hypothetical protein